MLARTSWMLALLMVGTMGCAKRAPEASYADYYEYDDYGGGAGGEAAPMAPAPVSMDAEMEMMEPAADYSPSRRERRADRMEKSKRGSTAPGSAEAPPAPEPTATGGGGDDGAEPAVADDGAKDVGRHIIYTATMQVSVFNLEDAMAKAEALPDRYGGYVQTMSGTYFVMRIPAVKLRPAMDELAALGVVDSRTLDAQDVTEEYLDIETRIEVLEATQKQMTELLSKARTVEEALKVRQALDQITMELEVLKGRLRRLESLTSYSTLTFSLVERGPHTATPSSNDPFPWVDELGVEATEWK
ncbi:DUF4349 domain-containing protein [Paraliomyxa miuraensis]|uniref:DUF4349 domain-containing protein n=1 Tax=Paraliomyxa miuraensis TaxID=376150 RepID=UPI00224EE362|nr:DUF4349 domain-containing protein [Paraliomyxa miuraensis]MCX4247092.1 DUF4349 domain-containing protein [Paraliomyxa miuraensis]